jgi:hypothetical protein
LTNGPTPSISHITFVARGHRAIPGDVPVE